MADHTDRPGRVGQQFGDYRLSRLLGSGSFAEVYLGEHLRERSPAAVKVLRARPTAHDWITFKNEASSLLRLRHPNIVPLLDVGMAYDQTIFMVMGYAPGGTLRQRHPRGTRLPLQTIVAYVKQIAAAMQYAHERGILHRDLKPENVLLGPNNEVWLSDFGLSPIAPLAGTLAYAPPEQLQGLPCPASDQYALAVMIYEWLCGTCPFTGSAHEIAEQQLHTAPPPLREHVPTISAEVEWVVLAALVKDLKLRFASVRAFAHALELASQHQPQPAIGTPLLTYGGHVGGANVVVWSPNGKYIASSSRDGTAQVWNAVTGTTIFTHRHHSFDVNAVAWSPDGSRLAFGLDGQVQVWGTVWGDSPDSTSVTCLASHSCYEAVEMIAWSPDGQRIVSKSGEPWGSESVAKTTVWDASTGATILTLFDGLRRGFAAPDEVWAVTWSADGSRLATSYHNGTVQVLDVATGTVLVKLLPGLAPPPLVQAREVSTETPRVTYRLRDRLVLALDWSSDGRRLALWDQDEVQIGDLPSYAFLHSLHSYRGQVIAVQLWDAASYAFLHSYRGQVIAWSPDGRRVALVDKDQTAPLFSDAASRDRTVQLWDVDSGEMLLAYRDHEAPVTALAWSPDGRSIASGSQDQTVQVWEASTGVLRLTYRGHEAAVSSVAWSPDGRRIASSSLGQVQLWDAVSGDTLYTYHGHSGSINGLAWSPDGTRIASASYDVQVWQAV